MSTDAVLNTVLNEFSTKKDEVNFNKIQITV